MFFAVVNITKLLAIFCVLLAGTPFALWVIGSCWQLWVDQYRFAAKRRIPRVLFFGTYLYALPWLAVSAFVSLLSWIGTGPIPWYIKIYTVLPLYFVLKYFVFILSQCCTNARLRSVKKMQTDWLQTVGPAWRQMSTDGDIAFITPESPTANRILNVDFKTLTGTWHISDWHCLERRSIEQCLEQATGCINHQKWCKAISQTYYGLGESNLFGIFLFRIQTADEEMADDTFWVVAGDLPPLCMAAGIASVPAAAMYCYTEIMMIRAEAAINQTPVDPLPVAAPFTKIDGEALQKRLLFVRDYLQKYHNYPRNNEKCHN